MTALTCPFCNSPIHLLGTPGRVVCPRCGEAIPAKLLPAATGTRLTENAPSQSVGPAPAKPALRPVTLFAGLLLAVSLVGLGVWYFTNGKKVDTVSTESKVPPATRPPLALAGLKHILAETQIVLALQPSPLLQYAERVGKTPEALLAEWGLPTGIFAGLANAGVPLDQIDHFVMSVGLPEPPSLPRLSIALFLRQPITREWHFREVLKARQDADKSGRAKVDLPGFLLPMGMHKFDDTTYLFSSDEKTLDGMTAPKEGADHLKPGVRESLRRVDPASFGWAATDNLDWANQPTLKYVAPLFRQGDLPRRLQGVRALALGLTLRPDLMAQAEVRLADAKAAGEFAAQATPKLADTRIELQAEQEWVTVRMPGATFANGAPGVLALFGR